MFGFGRSKPVPEYKAEGEIERVYHDIKQTLRVTGVNLNFRTWAKYPKFLPLMWDAVRPNLETRIFEETSDRVRAEAVRIADDLGRLNAVSKTHLGASQAYQVQAALDLYHYINPKLLLLTAGVQLALEGEAFGRYYRIDDGMEVLSRGAPLKMYPMAMVSERPGNWRMRRLFKDIKGTLSLSSVNSDYRTLALWPDYLKRSWKRLKPITKRKEYRRYSTDLGTRARSLARTLPYPIPLSRESVEEVGENAREIMETTESFMKLLPSLIINIALFQLDWKSLDQATKSPFPADTVPAAPRTEAVAAYGG